MRLIRAHVYNFGGLSNFRYDFTEGLNTFLQDNGWGKTTFATFLKVMFYGFLKNEINDCAIDEKKKYIPWQEGTFGGEIDFSTENKKYRIKRIFSKDENDNNDEITVLDLNEGKEVQKFGENIGESLFSLDVNAFQRSIFIGRNGISIEKASQSLNDRLKNMVNQINDLFMYDITIDKLNKKLNEYVKEDKTGAIDNINNKIELKKEILEVVENEIKNIDEAKKRMIELDSILSDTSNELESKKDLYENLIVRFENNEAVKKQISSVYSKKSNLDIEMNLLASKLGDNIPTNIEIDNIKKELQQDKDLYEQIQNLEKSYDEALKEYNIIYERYNGNIPSNEKIDGMQSLYSKIQAIKTSNSEDYEEPSKDYKLMKAAIKEDKDYLDKIVDVLCMQSDIQKDIQEIEENDCNLRHENEVWNDRKKSYNDMKNDVEDLSNRIKNNLYSKSLEYPSINECNDILDKMKENEKKHANLSFMNMRLESDQREYDNLTDVLNTLDEIPNEKPEPMDKPKKPHTAITVTGGVGAGIASIGVGVMINPIMSYVLASAGVIIVFGGLNKRRRYKIKTRKYDEYVKVCEKHKSNEEKKADYKNKQERLMTAINISKKMIENLTEEISKDKALIDDFNKKWKIDDELSVEKMSLYIEKVKNNIDDIKNQIDIESSDPKEEKILTKEDYNDAKSKLNMANENVERFLNGYGLSEDDLQRNDSQRAIELRNSTNLLLKNLDDKMRNINDIISKVSLYMVKENYIEVFATLRQMLNTYEGYEKRQNERNERIRMRNLKIADLSKTLEANMNEINNPFEDENFSDRLAHIRDDITNSRKYNENAKEIGMKNMELANKYDSLKEKIANFNSKYCKVFNIENDDYNDFFDAVVKYNDDKQAMIQLSNDIANLKDQLDTQKDLLTQENIDNLKESITKLEKYKDDCMVEYSKKEEFIKQSDKSIEVYPDILVELKELNESHKLAVSNANALRTTIDVVKKAKDNLYFRYLKAISDKLNSYLGLVLDDEELKGMLDVDFNICVEENGITHMADNYSTGYCDLIDFCMRLALVDILFVNESPFVILDDPFANLDARHLQKAKDLLNMFAENKQIIYFVCHDTRMMESTSDKKVERSAS